MAILKLRELGVLEKMGLSISHQSAHNILTVVELEGDLSPEIIKIILGKMLDKHQILKCFISKDTLCFHLNTDFTIPFKCVQIAETELNTLITQELNAIIGVNETPLLSVSYASFSLPGKSYLLFCFHHAIVDGIPCVLFVNDFLANYVAYCSNEKINTIYRPIALPVEKLITTKKESLFLNEPFLENHQNHSTIACYPIEDLSTGIHYAFLSEEKSQQIKTYCSSHGISIYALITASAIKALSIELALANESHASPINNITLINLRRALLSPVEQDELTFMSAPIFSRVECNQISTVDLAKNISRNMKLEIAHNKHIDWLQQLEQLINSGTSPESIVDVENLAEPAVTSSNLGEFSTLSDGHDFKVLNVYCCGTTHAYARHDKRFLVISSSYNNKLSIGIMFAHPAMSMEKAQLILDRIVAELDS